MKTNMVKRQEYIIIVIIIEDIRSLRKIITIICFVLFSNPFALLKSHIYIDEIWTLVNENELFNCTYYNRSNNNNNNR